MIKNTRNLKPPMTTIKRVLKTTSIDKTTSMSTTFSKTKIMMIKKRDADKETLMYQMKMMNMLAIGESAITSYTHRLKLNQIITF